MWDIVWTRVLTSPCRDRVRLFRGEDTEKLKSRIPVRPFEGSVVSEPLEHPRGIQCDEHRLGVGCHSKDRVLVVVLVWSVREPAHGPFADPAGRACVTERRQRDWEGPGDADAVDAEFLGPFHGCRDCGGCCGFAALSERFLGVVQA